MFSSFLKYHKTVQYELKKSNGGGGLHTDLVMIQLTPMFWLYKGLSPGPTQ